MARIAGVDLPKEKRLEIGLTYIFGIGRVSSNKIIKEAGLNPDIKLKILTKTTLLSYVIILKKTILLKEI